MNNVDILEILNRSDELFNLDYKNNLEYLKKTISNSKIIVLGGAGSIGSATIMELIKLEPKLIHVVDIDENNLVELVRKFEKVQGDGIKKFLPSEKEKLRENKYW